jgi:hypothetical protein
MGGLGIRPVSRTRHAAYFSSLMQMLTEFIAIHPLLDSEAMRATQLYRELSECRTVLLDQCSIPTTTSPNGESVAVLTQNLKPRMNSLELPSLSSPSSTLVKSIDETWSSAASHNIKLQLNQVNTARKEKQLQLPSQLRAKSSPVIAFAFKLQFNLTRAIEQSIYNKLFESCNASQRTILTACTKNACSGSFLTVVPTQFEVTYRMKNEQFCLAIRHRLGMLPYDELLHEECLHCLNRNVHRPSFLADPDHLHSCLTQTGSSVSRRHHRLVHQVAMLAKAVGFHTTVEPSFPAVMTAAAAPSDTGYTTVRSRDRGDLLLIRGNQVLLLDVSVTRPTSIMNLSQKEDVTTRPCVAAAIVEKRKHDRYDEECKKHGWKLIPVVFESYGALGKEGTKLLLDMAECADSPLTFLQHARSALSVALQCGNADISFLGTTHLQAHKHSFHSVHVSPLPSHPAGFVNASAIAP